VSQDVLSALRSELPDCYTVEGLLRKGGQGTVFRGTLDREPVAIKVFGHEHEPKRLQREIHVLQRLSCDHVVKLRRVDEITIGNFAVSVLAYEFHAGGDLRQVLGDDASPVSALDIARIGRQVGCGIQCLWAERCVHRDVKPDNIIRAGDARYVLVDVGLAMHLDLSQVTAPGAAPGTRGYQSPEQARGRRNLTVHSDVFSLGVTLYELATKRHPFNRKQSDIGRVQPKPLSTFRNDIPKELPALVGSMLEVRPSSRPTNLVDRFAAIEEDLRCSS